LITKLLFVAEFQLACVSQQHYVSLRLRTKMPFESRWERD